MSWRGTLPRQSSRTGRCAKWIRATRWRGCSTSGCSSSIAARIRSARSWRRSHPRCARPSRRGSRFSCARLAGNAEDAHAALTEEIEAVATRRRRVSADARAGLRAGRHAGAGAALARDCRRSWFHQLSVSRALRSLLRAPPPPRAIPAAHRRRASPMGEVRVMTAHSCRWQ